MNNTPDNPLKTNNPETWSPALKIGATILSACTLMIVLACGGVCGDGGDLEDDETSPGIENPDTQGEEEEEEEEVVTLDASSDIDTETLPEPIQTMLTCLSVTTAEELAATTPAEAKKCLKEHFGGKKGSGRQCKGTPEKIYSSEILDPCDFESRKKAKRKKLSSPREGLGRLHAVFVGDSFRGLMMQSTRPVDNSSASCGQDKLFAPQEAALKAQIDKKQVSKLGKQHYERAGLSYKIERSEVGELYPVIRDNFVLSISGEDDAPAFASDWSRNQVDELPDAKPMSRKMRNALKDIGSALECKRYKGSILGLLGKPLAKVRKDCKALKGNRNWAQWPVSEIRISESGFRFQLTALGKAGTIVEVFMRAEGEGQKFIRDMKKEMGKSTPYQCTAHAWRSGDYIVRARPAGNYVNLAFSLAETHDNFSMVIPGATLGSDWR